MSCGEDLDNAAFDASIRSQLAKAADTYASHVDLGARLLTVARSYDAETAKGRRAAVASGA